MTQSQGVGTNMEEKTVEPVLKNMTIKSAIAVRTNTLITLIAMIVNASLITQLLTLMFVLRRAVNATVRKTMKAELATCVKMSTMTILIALIVNASQTTPKMLPKFVIKKMAPAHVPRVTLVDNVMFVKMGTLVIPSAKVCSYNLFLVPRRFQI